MFLLFASAEWFESEFCQGEWVKVREMMGALDEKNDKTGKEASKSEGEEEGEGEVKGEDEDEDEDECKREYNITPIVVLLDDKGVPEGACAKSMGDCKRAAEAAQKANKAWIQGTVGRRPIHTLVRALRLATTTHRPHRPYTDPTDPTDPTAPTAPTCHPICCFSVNQRNSSGRTRFEALGGVTPSCSTSVNTMSGPRQGRRSVQLPPLYPNITPPLLTVPYQTLHCQTRLKEAASQVQRLNGALLKVTGKGAGDEEVLREEQVRARVRDVTAPGLPCMTTL